VEAVNTIHSTSATKQQDSNKDKSPAPVETVDTICSTSASDKQDSKNGTIQDNEGNVKFSGYSSNTKAVVTVGW
jgi:hypothetical protein